MKSRRRTDLSVYAGLGLCCALALCAASARGETPAVTITNSPTDGGPAPVPVALWPVVAAPTTTAEPLAVTAPAATAAPAASAAKPALEDDPENHVIGGLRRPATQNAAAKEAAKPEPVTLWSIGAPLAAVLLVLALVFWAVRKYLPGVRRLTGSGAIKVLARTHVAPRQSIALVRVGRKVLVIGQSADALTALGCLEDAEEVSEVLGQCESSKPDSATQNFRKVFGGVDKEFAAVDAVAEEESSAAPVADDEVARVRHELEDLTRKVREVAAARR